MYFAQRISRLLTFIFEWQCHSIKTVAADCARCEKCVHLDCLYYVRVTLAYVISVLGMYACLQAPFAMSEAAAMHERLHRLRRRNARSFALIIGRMS